MKETSALMKAVSIAIGLLLFCSLCASGQRRPPNIVLIVSDDMGYGDIGIHGSHDIPTPNIDALARVGIRFTDAYVSGPYCSPTRAGLMTGRYQQRFGHEFNPDGPATMRHKLGLPLSERTIADYLRAAGYHTALFGKWHLGLGEEFHPMSRGFDEFFGFLDGDHSYIDPELAGPDPLLDGRKPVSETPGYLTDVFTDRAVDFIHRQKDRPFFLYLAYNAVHTPLQAPEKYLNRFPQISDKTRRTYAAMLSAMDDGIGRTLAAIRDAGIEDNTLIIFFNDNGGPTMPGTTVNGSSNAPLRGSKRQTWEGGIHVPFIIRWKGKLPEGKTDSRMIIQLDVLPTALAAAGIKMSASNFDGVDLIPFLTGRRSDDPHKALYWRLGEHMAVREGQWKLVKTAEGRLYDADSTASEYLSGVRLYNLQNDIGESRNVAEEYPKKVQQLIALWKRWNTNLAKPLWGPNLRPKR